MAKADLITGLIFFFLGLYMMVEGLGMPGAGGFIEAGGEPGRVPVMLGAILSILATILIGRSIVRGARLIGGDGQQSAVTWSGWVRSGLTALGCSAYAVGLLGGEIFGWQVPYRAATFVFVFLFITCFEWAEAPEMGRRRWVWLSDRFPATARRLGSGLAGVRQTWAPYLWLLSMALLQALIVTLAVGYLFEHQLYVKLP